MEILNKVTNTAKDVFVMGKNIVKVVKEEVELYQASKDHDNYDYDEDYEDDEEGDDASKSVFFEQFEQFEGKVRDLVQGTFSKFKITKSEEQEELEARIAALEEKLSKLVEDSLDAMRKG